MSCDGYQGNPLSIQWQRIYSSILLVFLTKGTCVTKLPVNKRSGTILAIWPFCFQEHCGKCIKRICAAENLNSFLKIHLQLQLQDYPVLRKLEKVGQIFTERGGFPASLYTLGTGQQEIRSQKGLSKFSKDDGAGADSFARPAPGSTPGHLPLDRGL